MVPADGVAGAASRPGRPAHAEDAR